MIKRMKDSSINIINIAMIFIVVITIFIMGVLRIVVEYKLFDSQIQGIRNQYISNEKKTIKRQVNNAVEYIKHTEQESEQRLRDDIKERTYEEYDLAMSIYNNNKNTKSSSEIKKMITDALRNVRYNNGRGYYFISSLNGEAVLYSTKPELEGKSILNLQDASGNFSVKNEIALVNKQNEGFITGNWENPEYKDGKLYPKITFVKKFEPYNWYMGTGEYTEDVKKNIQEECLNIISQIKFGSNSQNYIFVDTYDGIEICNGVYKDYVGKNVWNIKDKKGTKIVQEIIKIAKEKDNEGFLTYIWSNPKSSSTFTKVSFVEGVPEWGWVVGAGFSIDQIDNVMKADEIETKKAAKRELANVSMAVVFAALIVFFITKYITDAIKSNFCLFKKFLDEASEGYPKLDIERLNYKEFKSLAVIANKMIEERYRFEEKLKIKTKQLHVLSVTDGLTQMYNHKYICDNLEIRVQKNKGNFCIAMIDVDYFKKINDTYGHQCGDEVLEKVASVIKSNITSNDMAGRYGGEEFLIIFLNKDIEEASNIVETMRKELFSTTISKREVKVTISVGIVRHNYENAEELIQKADEKLYKAKKNGRNRVEK
ncbi:sensor domain-containing diguanylate cyclase [Clostridium hydrogenum]|uniref:sensor domain-containing diguanylate cyclase n=1 Tax=Clostridium hydrogenum TaxID=2855764 RepID=UPI001F1FDB2E|nr:cache domain-containing protein [Clostridium hydrogenum]